MRLTNQRLAIMEYLEGNFSHPSVEDIYENVKRKLPRISKATVYQNLNLLTKEGRIRELDIKGVSRYEPSIDSHHHIICRNCGKIIDFESLELTEYSMKLAKRIKQMNIDSTNTNFYGLCKKCK